MKQQFGFENLRGRSLKSIRNLDFMISYEPFYMIMKSVGISTYKLINEFNVSRSLLDRLRHNKPISTQTLDDLCGYLDCRVEDILEYKK